MTAISSSGTVFVVLETWWNVKIRDYWEVCGWAVSRKSCLSVILSCCLRRTFVLSLLLTKGSICSWNVHDYSRNLTCIISSDVASTSMIILRNVSTTHKRTVKVSIWASALARYCIFCLVEAGWKPYGFGDLEGKDCSTFVISDSLELKSVENDMGCK